MAFFVMLACLFSLGCESKEDRLIKQREERNKEIDSYLEEAEEKRIAFIEKTKREQYVKRIKEDYFQSVENLKYTYEQNIKDIKHNFKLRKMEIAEKQGADTWKNKMQRLEVEEQYQDGKISKHERKYKLLLLDQELERITERAKIQTAHEEDLALADKQGDAEGKRNTALGEASRLQDVKMSLPTVDEMAGLFREQSSAKDSLNATGRSLAKIQEKIEE